MKTQLFAVLVVLSLASCKKDEPANPSIPQPIVRHLYVTGVTGDEMGVFVARATQSDQEYHWTQFQGDTLTLTLNVGAAQSSIYRHDTVRFVGHVTSVKAATVWLDGLSPFNITLDPVANDQVAHTLITDW